MLPENIPSPIYATFNRQTRMQIQRRQAIAASESLPALLQAEQVECRCDGNA